MQPSKLILSAVAVAATVGFAAPAAAVPLPATWTGPYKVITPATLDCANTGTGGACGHGLNLHGSVFGTNHAIAYAGPLTVQYGLLPIPPNSTNQLIVFCDDLAKNIAINHTYNNFYKSDPSAPADVVSYLNVSLSVAHEIMGLTALGTFDDINHSLTPQLGAAFQVAIWELEYNGTATLTGDAGFQTTIDGLIANASADYTFFTNPALWAVPWSFTQFESPCNVANVGLVTKDPPQSAKVNRVVNPNCQNEQGLIAAIPGVPRETVPEPITLSLFGAGLAGVVGYRRRRKNEGK